MAAVARGEAYVNEADQALAGAFPIAPRCYGVNIRRHDGTSIRRVRVGGEAMDHAIDAIEDAGEGARIEVKLLRLGAST